MDCTPISKTKFSSKSIQRVWLLAHNRRWCDFQCLWNFICKSRFFRSRCEGAILLFQPPCCIRQLHQAHGIAEATVRSGHLAKTCWGIQQWGTVSKTCSWESNNTEPFHRHVVGKSSSCCKEMLMGNPAVGNCALELQIYTCIYIFWTFVYTYYIYTMMSERCLE